MKFEWDEKKNQLNIDKHGLDFVEVLKVFKNSHFTFEDKRFDYGESCFITLGKANGRIMIVVHTERKDKIRIISMRKANAREQKKFENKLEKNRFNEG